MVAELIWPVNDSLCVAKELDAVLWYQFPTFRQLAMDLLVWRALCWFHARDALVAARLARIVSFAIALASKPSAYHVTVL